MTIPSSPRKAGPFNGTGSQTAWPFAFKVFAASDVKVTAADAEGTETVLVLNTDYSVTLNPNQGTSPGGTVTYPISGSPLPVGGRLTVTGDLPYDQTLDIPSGGNFSPLALENQLDRTTMQVQQLAEEVERAVKVPVTEGEGGQLSADLAQGILRLADSADNIDTVANNLPAISTVADNVADVNTVASNIGNVAATGANIAAVVTVANDLNEPVSEIDTVATNIADVNTVGQNIGAVNTTAANLSSISTVAANIADVSTVAENVTDVTNFADVYYGPRASDPATRNDGSASQPGDMYFNTGTKRTRVFDDTAWVEGSTAPGTYTVDVFSGDGAETTFALSVAPVSKNNTQVFIGGVYQQKSQYEIAGTSITFTAAPPLGVNNVEVASTTAASVGSVDSHFVPFAGTTAFGALSKAVLSYADYAAASAAAAALPDGQRVNVEADETKFGRSTKRLVQAGTLVYLGLAANADSVLYGERTQAERNADIVTVKDKGAKGNGIDDDTAAIDQAKASTGSPYFSDGTYIYNGDVNALLSKPLSGPGVVRYAGFDYPVVRGDALNALWAGEFRCWQMGHAFNVETTQRRHIPAGVTHARLNLTGGTTVYHTPGTHLQDAMRVQRNAGDVSTDSHVAVMNLTREEAETLVGKRCVLQFNGRKGETYSGSGITVRVQYSVEQEQPILNADGTYASGNVNLLEQTVVLGAEARPEVAPYFFTFDLPENATQMAVILVVPFAGTAGENDYVEMEGFSIHPGSRPANILRESFSALMFRAKTRYQSSLPYGAPRGTNTEQGSISAVAINNAASFAFQMSVRFDPPMALPPQFIFQSPTSGTESRLLNKDTGANINGLAYALSEAGVVIANSAAAIAGNRYLCHWTAQVIF